MIRKEHDMMNELDGINPGQSAVEANRIAMLEELKRRRNMQYNFENDINYLISSVAGFNESHRQLLDMEKKLYKHYLNKKEFDIRSCVGELNMGLLTDILTEEELDSDKEDLLLSLVVRFGEDVIKDIPNGQEVWESASAYDFTNVFKNLGRIVYLPETVEEFGQYLYSDLMSRVFMTLPLRHDLSIEIYRRCLQDTTVTLQELLIVVYILDNIGMQISENTAKILLTLVNDDEFYTVSDYPIIESIKNFAVLTLNGKVETIAE